MLLGPQWFPNAPLGLCHAVAVPRSWRAAYHAAALGLSSDLL